MLTVVGAVAFDTLALVKALPSAEETGGVLAIHPDTHGGTGGNVAMALARLGAPVRLLAAVGPDFAKTSYAADLARSNIPTGDLLVGSLPTSRAYIFYDATGAQRTYFFPGASTEFRPSQDAIAGGRLHCCAGEIARYPPLMRRADWVSFDPGQELFHRDFAQIEACLSLADVLFVNRHELAAFEKRGWPLDRLLAEGPNAVVETRGPEGTRVHASGLAESAPAVDVRAIEPTGAGDAHRAGFLYALEQGADLAAAARFANVLGSFAVEAVGAQRGHPTLAQAVARYEKAYGGTPFKARA